MKAPRLELDEHRYISEMSKKIDYSLYLVTARDQLPPGKVNL